VEVEEPADTAVKVAMEPILQVWTVVKLQLPTDGMPQNHKLEPGEAVVAGELLPDIIVQVFILVPLVPLVEEEALTYLGKAPTAQKVFLLALAARKVAGALVEPTAE
jgi:hypothetical protein